MHKTTLPLASIKRLPELQLRAHRDPAVAAPQEAQSQEYREFQVLAEAIEKLVGKWRKRLAKGKP